MFTLFAIPKPFQGHIGIVQRNAIGSWKQLHPDCEIILCGDDLGTRESAIEFGTKYLPDIVCNEYGTPLINSVFEKVEEAARQPLLCYVNADIILMRNFIWAVQAIPFRTFMMVGQRWDADITQLLEFEAEKWEGKLRNHVSKYGSMHPPTGIDYFVFSRGIMGRLPRFAVGRPAWDNWMIYRARSMGIPVIDATLVTTVVHQNHGYTHVKHALDDTAEGPEAVKNRDLAGGWENIFNIKDATHILTGTNGASMHDCFQTRRKWATLPLPVVKWRKRVGYLTGAVFRGLKRWLQSSEMS
jgi:hypothetical protein